MALGAVLGAALTDHSARKWGIYVDGLDLASEPASTRRYGATVDDVRLSLAGPGDVSRMTWSVDDPLGQLVFTDGQQVAFRDLSRDVLWFRGWMESYAEQTWPPTGRRWALTAIGVESLLDWYVTGVALTFAAGSSFQAAVQAIAGSAIGIGELRAFADPAILSGTDALPIGGWNITLAVAVSIPANTILREALLAVGAAISPSLPGGAIFTVDHNFGLRAWSGSVFGPGAQLNAVNTAAGTQYHGSDTELTLDMAPIVRAVVVVGTGVTVTVSDGTGLRGRTAILNDQNITAVDQAQAAGAAYLAARGAELGAAATLEYDGAPVGAHTETTGAGLAFAMFGITDPAILTVGQNFLNGLATVTFFGDKPNVRMSAGSSRRSGARLIRRLTRGTLS
jgi:hypothetical protein